MAVLDLPEDVGVYELVADQMWAGERVVGVAQEGVGRVPWPNESSESIFYPQLGTDG